MKCFGLSEVGADTIRKAYSVQSVTAVLNQYSMWTWELEGVVIPACEQLGIGFVEWGPLGTKFLTGTIYPDAKFDAATDLRPSF